MILPDWVLIHKQKGTTIRFVHGKYFVYRVHSQRQVGKKYPVLIQDEFLGVITEKGFIRSTNKLIDITNIETICLVNTPYLLIDTYTSPEIDILKEIYLVKVQGKWYFPKLSKSQEIILKEHHVEVTNGIIF